MSSPVIYQHIEDTRIFTEDDFWSSLIHSCACNKFPRWVKYDPIKSAFHIKYESSGKSHPDPIPLSTNPKKCYETIMYVFKELLKVRSETDVDNSKMELEVIRKGGIIDIEQGWNKLKPKSIKNNMLMTFATVEIELHDLPPKKINVLYKLIHLGFQLKNLTASDVNYKSGVVLSIRGLEFNESMNFFELTHERGPVSRVCERPAPKFNILKKSIDTFAKNYKSSLIKL